MDIALHSAVIDNDSYAKLSRCQGTTILHILQIDTDMSLVTHSFRQRQCQICVFNTISGFDLAVPRD